MPETKSKDIAAEEVKEEIKTVPAKPVKPAVKPAAMTKASDNLTKINADQKKENSFRK